MKKKSLLRLSWQVSGQKGQRSQPNQSILQKAPEVARWTLGGWGGVGGVVPQEQP